MERQFLADVRCAGCRPDRADPGGAPEAPTILRMKWVNFGERMRLVLAEQQRAGTRTSATPPNERLFQTFTPADITAASRARWRTIDKPSRDPVDYRCPMCGSPRTFDVSRDFRRAQEKAAAAPGDGIARFSIYI